MNTEPDMPGRWQCMPGSFYYGDVSVRLRRRSDRIVARFTPGQWRNIFSDITDDSSLAEFLDQSPDTRRAYMLYAAGESEPFGWIYLCRTDPVMCDTVEFHGGSWRDSIAYSMKKFTASCVVIDYLQRQGIRVNSRAYRSNTSAIKFLQAIGFRISRRASARPWHFLTLSRRRFLASPLVRRVFTGPDLAVRDF